MNAIHVFFKFSLYYAIISEYSLGPYENGSLLYLEKGCHKILMLTHDIYILVHLNPQTPMNQ